MLARRLRRRPNIDPALIQCLVIAETESPSLYVRAIPTFSGGKRIGQSGAERAK